MNATVVELDSLADAVGTAAEDHNLLFAGIFRSLVLHSPGGVVVRGIGDEFSGASIDECINRGNAQFQPFSGHFFLGGIEEVCDLAVSVTELFGLAEQGFIGGKLFEFAGLGNFVFEVRQFG